MRNVVIPDAVEGTSVIDWVVLTYQGILILKMKNYRGMIFASDSIRQWTQVIARRSFTFDNPLQQLDIDMVTIRTLAPGINLKGYVVFGDDSHFPKGRPKNVTTVSEIKQNLHLFKQGEISEELLAQWNKLVPLLKQEPEVQDHYAPASRAGN
ncbi:MAG: NERD domain-containing protein [Gammaproteobacteria bacterium]|nr:NERD domain-containing protein [Gammaproteobacteria bacterium]